MSIKLLSWVLPNLPISIAVNFLFIIPIFAVGNSVIVSDNT